MSRRDKIRDLYALTSGTEKLAMANSPPAPAESPERAPAGPVRSMGLALDRIEEESRALQQALATGAAIVEIETDRIEASIVRDRLPETDGPAFDAFRRSIAERGQEVPVLVRPHPEREGRFQLAYGHRRLRALASLGRKIRAVVRPMSDVELIVAQGVENSQRKDLSYIEKALFAARLEDRGFERSVIIDALATDKGELSKLISVARAVPEALVEAIGPAPKAGRRRWLQLAEALEDARARRRAEQSAADPDLAEADSDTRFVRVLAAATKAERPSAAVIDWKNPAGRTCATVARNSKAISLAFAQDAEPEFGEFVVARLDDLYSQFLSRAKAND